MDNLTLIESFSEFKDDKLIDRVTLMAILEEVFRSALRRKYGDDENFDIIINPDKGDLEIWRNRIVVEDDNVEDDNLEIGLTEARKIEPDFEVGEDVSEEVKLIDLGRRSILALRQNLTAKIHEHDNTNVYKKFKELEGEIYTAEVHHIRHKAIILLDDEGEELNKPNIVGKLCIKYPWPSIARTIWGNHQRYIDTYFSAFKNMYFTGDGAFKDKEGNFRITGRVDDVIIVSGHNLGTAPIEDAINEHESIVESAIVGFPHEIKGNALYGFITLKYNPENINHIKTEINSLISEKIGPIAKLDKIQITSGLPKTRSGKIMRRILRKIASNQTEDLGDISTLLNPDVVQEIIDNYQI